MTSKADEHVTLVVDPGFGGRARNLALRGPLWVIDSPLNTPVIKELWAAGVRYDAKSPTCFDAVADRSREDSAIAFVWTVNDHHPKWRTLEIVGVPPSAKLMEAIRQCADGSVIETDTGLIFSRLSNSQQDTK